VRLQFFDAEATDAFSPPARTTVIRSSRASTLPYAYKTIYMLRRSAKNNQVANFMAQVNGSLMFFWFAYSLVGWLLSAYHVPTVVWIGTLVMTLYLAWTGLDAIAVASIWVVGVLSIGAIRHAWMWRIFRPFYQIEPLTLLLIWLLSLGLVVLTAIAHKRLQERFGRVQVFYRLAIPIWLGLVLGLFMYHQFTLPLLLR